MQLRMMGSLKLSGEEEPLSGGGRVTEEFLMNECELHVTKIKDAFIVDGLRAICER